jgi:hypothetical protein
MSAHATVAFLQLNCERALGRPEPVRLTDRCEPMFDRAAVAYTSSAD